MPLPLLSRPVSTINRTKDQNPDPSRKKMTHKRPLPLPLLDALCTQEQVEHDTVLSEEEEKEEGEEEAEKNTIYPLFFLHLNEDDRDGNLLSLFSKEEEPSWKLPSTYLLSDPFLAFARRECVEWILRVVSHFSFSALTALLSVNYLDRFLATISFQRDKPWMAHLIAVACLSLAVKLQETQLPSLMDLQVEGTKCVFEAKTIQRMELVVLSTLQWKMNPVTPLSFIEHIIVRLELKPHQLRAFFRRCKHLLFSLVADSRVIHCLPSVIAAATVLHVNHLQYENQILSFLNLAKEKEKVEDCLQLILEYSCMGGRKRRLVCHGSPDHVIGSSFSCQGSNQCWPASRSSSPQPP